MKVGKITLHKELRNKSGRSSLRTCTWCETIWVFAGYAYAIFAYLSSTSLVLMYLNQHSTIGGQFKNQFDTLIVHITVIELNANEIAASEAMLIYSQV